jgi:gliding motility-associated-like protein
VQTFGDTLICKGGEAQISVVGGSACYWELPIGDSARVQKISPDEATIYYVYTFSEKRCTKLDSVMVDVMQGFDAEIDGQSFSINMGDTAVAVVVADSGLECYVSPEEYSLSGNCDSIRMFPLENTTFTLVLRDTLGCAEKSFDIYVDVDLKLTLDVPSAFTPLSEGDGNNVVYVRGLGIKRLHQFRIYNRWGEEVFFTDDLHTGWDGTIGGVVQNQDTYSYYVEAEMLDGSVRTKKGNVVLIK